MENPDQPTINRAVVVCPTSLVKNWDDEVVKWLKGKVKTIALYGTLEEKIFQRQLSKEGLQSIVDDKEEVNSLSTKDLKRLFVFMEGTPSDTHDQLKCQRCKISDENEHCDHSMMVEPQIGYFTCNCCRRSHSFYHSHVHVSSMPAEEDLNNWSHHYSYATVEDEIMQEAQANQNLVSFVFSCRVDWELFQVRAEKERQEQLAIDQDNLFKTNKRHSSDDGEDGDSAPSTDEVDIEQQLPTTSKRIRSTGRSCIAKDKPHTGRIKRRPEKTYDSSEEELSDDVGDSQSDNDEFLYEKPPTAKRPKPVELSESEVEFEGGTTVVQRHQPARMEVISGANNDCHDVQEEQSVESSNTLEMHSTESRGYASPRDDETKEEVIWACNRCTMHNPIEVDSCEGCGMPQPRRAKKHLSPSIYVE
ncbi:hypothetical protein DYB32_000181 [Aphanomyces invadans]|uniref:RanBP2-type domain-containing protein n=1 Tax=Aphanomyces invadans TaxID=157072 RepID=A0A3R6Z6B4_9STRA|nr:hypothetical protein DYB32_000181 [Aphanomyces invadans]